MHNLKVENYVLFIGHTEELSPQIALKDCSEEVKKEPGDFPGGAVVKNPPANAGDRGSSPGPGRAHMPQSN